MSGPRDLNQKLTRIGLTLQSVRETDEGLVFTFDSPRSLSPKHQEELLLLLQRSFSFVPVKSCTVNVNPPMEQAVPDDSKPVSYEPDYYPPSDEFAPSAPPEEIPFDPDMDFGPVEEGDPALSDMVPEPWGEPQAQDPATKTKETKAKPTAETPDELRAPWEDPKEPEPAQSAATKMDPGAASASPRTEEASDTDPDPDDDLKLDPSGSDPDEESDAKSDPEPSDTYQKPAWQIERERELNAQMQREREERAAKVREHAASNGGSGDGSKEKKVHVHQEGAVVFGKVITQEAVPIRDLDLESDSQINDVVIEGEILSSEMVDISDKSYLLRFDITDKTNSLSAKKFLMKSHEDTVERAQALIKPGSCFKLRGKLSFDNYDNEKVLNVQDMVCAPMPVHEDTAEVKRVELHMHTQYSAMDCVNKVKAMMKRAKEFGHDAVAITDHGVLQAYPEVQKLAKDLGIKALYGVEGYLVDTGNPIVIPGEKEIDENLDGEFIFFDLETTGLSAHHDSIIEIAAVRIRNGQIIDTFSRLVDPHRKLSRKITELTGLTDEDLEGQAEEEDAIREFYEYVGDTVLAAHNAQFDTGFLRIRRRRYEGKNQLPVPVIDTLPLAQTLIPDIKTYKLSRLCSYFKIKNEHAHRALEDSRASAKVMVELFRLAKDAGAERIGQLEDLKNPEVLAKKQSRPWHIIIFAKNQEGLRDLYELVSISHLQYFQKRPRIPRSVLMKFRKNLILGSACVAGELYQAILDEKEEDELLRIASFYDYLEVQPLGNNLFLTQDDKLRVTHEDLKAHNRKIIELGEKLGKPVCATGDVHFLNKEDAIFRAVLTSQMHDDSDTQPPLYYRNTQEMLDEFKYLPEEKAYEIVVENPRKVADWIDAGIKPVPDETYPPVIEGAEDDIRNMCVKRAHEIYGEELPAIVEDRMNRELNSIIGNGYAVLYLIAQKLVENSENAGYLVGSRGSVGSSFAAMLSGITEVNSLPPHYVCPKCYHSEFFDNSKLSGPDLPDKNCPECGTLMHKDGYDIPFETFLGFEGDKEPDIDLNFSGDNQADAHAYTEVLFGKGKTFRAGTISTLAEKTAYGYVKAYFADRKIRPTKAEVERLKNGCTGVKRTTGQHPGGIMVVPRDQEIYKFTPVQHPADDPDSNTITTHFDYHSISGRLLKLDILGHDDPTMLRILYENTGVNPRSIPLDDKEVLSLFQGTEALHFIEDCPLDLGTAGVPEFGTKFTKQMVRDAKPKTLADLIRISGLSHGTDVWTNNAQLLVNNHIATIDEVISTRDDIMLGLIGFGLPPKSSFSIMEHVRKGKGLTPDEEALMLEHDVPDWYIDSCKKIQYMFPKAHAAAYVIMAFRIAWYKINYPAEYYAAYFGIRAKEFDLKVIQGGLDSVRDEIKRLNDKSKSEKLSNKEELSMVSLELALEMYCRGYSCSGIDLERSDSRFFIPDGKTIIPPFTAVPGLGMSVAENIVRERNLRPFISQDDLQERTKLNNTNLEALVDLGCLRGLPKSDQISFFSMGM